MAETETGPRLGARFREALGVALEVHAADTRKEKTTPFMAHLLEVCALVLHGGGDEDQAIAALLHDTIEDHPEAITRAQIRERFGAKVLEIVEACTDTGEEYRGGPKEPWRVRKDRYIAHIEHASPEARQVSLADKIANAREMLADYRFEGEHILGRFKGNRDDQLWYYTEILRVMQEQVRSGWLLNEYALIVGELVRELGGARERR